MEAADDIAYSVLDIEDAIHKGIISPDDVRAIIAHELGDAYNDLNDLIDQKFSEVRKRGLSIRQTREIMSSYLRTFFIERLIREAMQNYRNNKESIFGLNHLDPIIREPD